MLLKGASEYILNACEKIHYWDTDKIETLDAGVKKEIHANIKSMAKDTLRTLCMGYKEIKVA